MSVTRAGENAVDVTTTQPDPVLPARLSSPQLPILAARAYRHGTVDPTRAATGPFILTDIDGVSAATMERNDRYWGQHARADGIDVTYVPDGSARAAALRTGEADIVEAIPVAQAPLLEKRMLTPVTTARTNTLYLNTASGPFADPRLRVAAREAINRSALVQGIYEGHAEEASGLLGPALPWTRGRRRQPAVTIPAAQPQGQRIVLATYSDRPEMPEAAAVLEQQLQRAGFRVKQEVSEYSQIEADALAGTFDAFILSRATVLDSADPVAYLESDFTCDGTYNISQLCHSRVDRLVHRAAATPVGPQRHLAILNAEEAILATGAAVPLLHERVIQGVAADVRGVSLDPRERLLVTARTQETGRGER